MSQEQTNPIHVVRVPRLGDGLLIVDDTRSPFPPSDITGTRGPSLNMLMAAPPTLNGPTKEDIANRVHAMFNGIHRRTDVTDATDLNKDLKYTASGKFGLTSQLNYEFRDLHLRVNVFAVLGATTVGDIVEAVWNALNPS